MLPSVISCNWRITMKHTFSIGSQRLIRSKDITTDKVRLRVTAKM